MHLSIVGMNLDGAQVGKFCVLASVLTLAFKLTNGLILSGGMKRLHSGVHLGLQDYTAGLLLGL